jgi:pimeloyl-ACP methyl ester carboxylesterase
VLPFVASILDRAVSKTVLKRGGRTRAEAILGPEARIVALRRALSRYRDPLLIAEPERFFPAPPLADPSVKESRRHADLTFESGYAPFNEEIGPEYLAHHDNRVAHVRLVFSRAPRIRGTTILLHGYLGGVHAVEQRLWPVRWFLRQGLHVALFTLPFHGPRGRPLATPVFPGSDPRFTIEGFRQAVHDLRRLVGWLEAKGHGPAGVMGMSLGGYTSALLATVDPRIRFVVPIIPLASIALFARDRGRFNGSAEQQAAQHELIEAIYRPVSPLARPPLAPRAGRLVVAGEADRIVPLTHARMIATHFDAPLETFRGGHLIQLGRDRALFRRVGEVI